jgi:WD40 repeat protein
MPTPYHVRLAISQYGESFRAELFTEDLGDTEGDLLTELPPSIAEWVPYLAQGADLPPDAARQLGKDLFAALLGQPENAKKWSEVLTQAARKGQSIRLLIDATTEAVRDLPYGLMCEPHDDWFLFRGGKKTSVEFVRILRRCSPRPLNLRERLRVLVAVAEPTSPDVPPFDAATRLQKFAAAVHKDIDLFVCGPGGPKPLSDIAADPTTAPVATFAPFTKTTRDTLRKALVGTDGRGARGEPVGGSPPAIDVFHLLAHGHGAGVLLCTDDGKPAETTASELAEWCGAGKTALAFLQVCKAGQTAGRGGFGGVAQQLLNPRGGNLAAVVASTFPLDAEHSTDAAVDFYRHLAAGKPPEEALTAERPESDWCWAFLELWARPGALGGGNQRAAFQFVSPYRGLSSFSEQDADLFFGRKTEVAELLQILRAEPAVAVVGDSGSGKSSLLQAGLVHAIRCEGLAGSDKWRIVTLRPGYRPAQSLLTAVFGGTKGSETQMMDERTLRNAVKSALKTDERPLVLIFDQFEEVFTLARDRAEVQMLIDELTNAVEHQRERFRLVLGMRSEFLGQAASLRGLSRLIRRPWVLRPPSAGDTRDIVGGPAEHCGYTFQGPLADGTPAHAVGLLDRILADPLLARDEGGATAAPLPLLQFALERLWLKAVEKGVTEFTHAQFDEVGGMGKAIAQHAEAVFQASATGTEAGPQGRALAEQIITALVSSKGTRQPRVRDALQAETGCPEAARAVVDYLVGERLLTIRTDPEDMSKSLVDLSHEALILNWDRLRAWLAEDPQGRAMREEFRTAAEKWESGFAGVKPKSWFGLPGSDVARNYLTWINTSKPRLGPIQQEFAQAMRDMLRRQKRIRRSVMAALAGLAIASLLLAVLAYMQTGRAKQSATDAKISEEAAKKSEADAKTNEAIAKDAKRKAEDEKRKADIQAATLALEKGIQISEEGHTRSGILSMAYALQLCPPDATDLRRVILTNLASWGPHLMCLDEIHTFQNQIGATDSAGKYALTARIADTIYADRAVYVLEFQLFEIDTEKSVGPPFRVQWTNSDGKLFRHLVERARMSRDGTVLFTGGGYSSVWNTFTGKPLGPAIQHGQGIAALQPGGKLIAAGDGQGNIRIYDVASGKSLAGPFPHMGKVNDMAFSADGQYLVSGCGRRADVKRDKQHAANPDGKPREGVVHLYEFGVTSEWPIIPMWHTEWMHEVPGIVTCVQISPDQKRVTGGGFELYSWQLDGKPMLNETRNSPESVVYIEFDPKATTNYLACNPSGALQIIHSDDAIRVSGERLSPQGWLNGVGFRADGRVFTANSDGTVRIWNRPRNRDATGEGDRVSAPPRAEAILCVAFRPDGKAVALGSRTGVVYLFDLEKPDKSGKPTKEFRCTYNEKGELRQPVTEVRFSTDGTRIIAHDQMLTTFVFDAVGDPSPPLTAKGGIHPQGVADDGRTALFTSRTGTPYLIGQLDPSSEPKAEPKFNPRGELATLYDEAETWFLFRATRVAFSPDKSLVAMLNTEGTIHMFRTATGERVCEPLKHTINGEFEGIHSVAFCPRGTYLLTRSPRARGIWSAATGKQVHYLENRIGIQVARFSPSGRFVVGGTNFSQAQAWESANGDMAVPLPMVHGAQVWGVAADQTDSRIITASFDHSARIWDRVTGRPLTPPLLHKLGVSEATFSPDGKYALTGSWDGTARLWEVPQPVPDDLKRIEAWVETMTGLKIAPNGGGELLKPDEWRARKKRLDELGGPPVTIDP